jgi:hypothetical protein
MLRRFAAATAVISVLLFFAAAVVLVIPGLAVQRIYPILWIWAIIPCVWGVWAILCPAAWVPQRFPAWGALLGTIAAVMALFVIQLPQRVLQMEFSVPLRALLVVGAAVVYYVLWMMVGNVYRKLAASSL